MCLWWVVFWEGWRGGGFCFCGSKRCIRRCMKQNAPRVLFNGSKSVPNLSYTFRTFSVSFYSSVSRSKSVTEFGNTFRTESVSLRHFCFSF